jgi:hypothetical protein
MRTLAAGVMLIGLTITVLGPLLVGTFEAQAPDDLIQHIDVMLAGGLSVCLLGALLFALAVLLGQD